jgi:hypothetical protein
MEQSDKIVELLQEIVSNQKKQIDAASKIRSTYLKVCGAALVLVAVLYMPYLLQFLT